MLKKIKISILVSVLTQIPIYANINSDIKNSVLKSHSTFLKKVYANSSYESIWVNSSGLTSLGKELISQMNSDKTLYYDLPFYKLYKQVKSAIKAKKYSAKLDIKMSKLYKAYMDYLIKGGINWKAFDAHIEKLRKKYDYKVGWEKTPPPYSSYQILQKAKLNGTFDNYFTLVEPKRFKYKKLKSYLAQYIKIAQDGGWKVIKGNTTLKVGSSNPNIPIIRKRLKLVGDLGNCSASMDSTIYDSCMAKAVKRFKLRHGIKASPTIGKEVRLEFKRPISYYIKKMRLNLDRIKWIKREEARVRIELNIPAFRLYLYDGKKLVTTMRVITGKPNHPTPVFSDTMTTIVVNPYWRIPESIVKKEMIKHLVKNPHYYDKQHKFLYDGWGSEANRVNPAKVNWRKYKGNKKHIPYHFMQSPGTKNALGKIKFLFPNKYSVYIHDTPGKRKFFKTIRAFSHGCMRIQKPRELLEALALYNSNVKVDSIMKRLGTDKTKHIPLRRRIPVDITYLTSFVDDYGNLHFRKDIYGYDRAQLRGYLKSGDTKTVSKKQKKESKKVSSKEKSIKSKRDSNKKDNKPNKPIQKVTKPKYTKPKVPKVKKPDYEVIEIGY